MKFVTLSILLLSFYATGKMVPNADYVKSYNKQREGTVRIYQEVQSTLKASNAIVVMHRELGYIVPEIATINAHFQRLQDDAWALYGNDLILNPTHFDSCVTLPSSAKSLWVLKLDSDGTDKDVKSIVHREQQYIKQQTECELQINTPPPPQIEMSDNPEVIDVAPPSW